MDNPIADKQSLERERMALAALVESFNLKAKRLGAPPLFGNSANPPETEKPPHPDFRPSDPQLAAELETLNARVWRDSIAAEEFAKSRGWVRVSSPWWPEDETSIYGPVPYRKKGWFVHLNLKSYKEVVGIDGHGTVWKFEEERSPAKTLKDALEELNEFYWQIRPTTYYDDYWIPYKCDRYVSFKMSLLPEYLRFNGTFAWNQYPVDELGWTVTSVPGVSTFVKKGGLFSSDKTECKWDGKWWVFSKNGWDVTVEIDPEDKERLRFVPVGEQSAKQPVSEE